jgi:glycosyltransferase involved in cell wall biosynthesis
MRTLYFLLPGTQGKYRCGGLFVELKTVELARQFTAVEVVTYRQREAEYRFLPDVLRQGRREDVIFVVSWGFDVGKLAARLRSHHVVYHAHSAGYGFQLPAGVPIICVSRNTMGYWGQHAPHAPIYYLPNQISADFCHLQLERDIDVLVQVRKSSSYLLEQLVPTLQRVCRVQVVTTFVEDLPKLFNRAKIYLYDSAEYWAQQGVTEGFGMQPLEALACGCHVFSSVNHGLSDYLDPGFNCSKIAAHSQDYDVQRILRLLELWQPMELPETVLAEYRVANIQKRLGVILRDVNHFFDCKPSFSTTIPPLTRTRILQLQLKRGWSKLQQRLLRSQT